MITFPLDSLIIGKNEEYGYPIVDRPYTAEQLREVYKTFFSNGVFMNEQDAFQVTPGEGMNVIVAPGKCLIEGAVGYEKAQRQLAVQAASTTADRIDTVVLRLNLNVEVRNIDLYVKTGTAQDVPVRPTLTRSESVWELGIGDLFIAKNSGAISSARITDTRLQTDRCGAVAPFMEVDTTGFFDQLQAQTQIAVDLAQSAIDETLAGDLQSQINENKEAIEENAADIDKLNKAAKTISGSKGYSLQSGGWVKLSIPMQVPAGYYMASMLSINTASASAVFESNVSISGSSIDMTLVNRTSVAQNSTVYVSCLCLPVYGS